MSDMQEHPQGPQQASEAAVVDAPSSEPASSSTADGTATGTIAPEVTSAPTSAASSVEPTVKAELDRLLADVSIPARIAINTILEYIDRMTPGRPISISDGTIQQVNFYRALTSIINHLEADFRPTLTAVLYLLHEHREGVFRETHIFRFVEHIPLSKVHRRGFEKITTLLKTLADPKSRPLMLRQIDFEPLLKYGLTEKGRVRLTAYFGK